MTNPMDRALPAASLADPAATPEEPSAREIAWIATYGPGTAQDAVRLLASSRARRLLAHRWAQECPSAQLLDAAVPPADADEDAELHAQAVRTLLTVHTRTCPACRSRLEKLQAALATLDREIGLADQIMQMWAFTLTEEGALARSADQDEPAATRDRPYRRQLDDAGLYRALTGRERTERDRWPSLTLSTTPGTDPGTTQLTIHLIARDTLPTVRVTAILHLPAGPLHIPLTDIDEDRIQLSGHLTTDAWEPTDTLTVEVHTRSA